MHQDSQLCQQYVQAWHRGLSFVCVMMQIRGLQAQLADARQEQKAQAADKAALQARLQAANDKSAAQDAEKGKLQASGALLLPAMLPLHNALHCF